MHLSLINMCEHPTPKARRSHSHKNLLLAHRKTPTNLLYQCCTPCVHI